MSDPSQVNLHQGHQGHQAIRTTRAIRATNKKMMRTMENNEKLWKTMKNNGKQWKSMKNDEKRWKTMKNYEKLWKTMKNNEKQWKTIKKMRNDAKKCIIFFIFFFKIQDFTMFQFLKIVDTENKFWNIVQFQIDSCYLAYYIVFRLKFCAKSPNNCVNQILYIFNRGKFQSGNFTVILKSDV